MMAQFESRLKILDLVVKLGWALLFGAFCLGVWASTLEFRLQEVHAQADHTEANAEGLMMWKAETNGNRYTSTEASKDKSLMLEMINIQDKRLARVEDIVTRMDKSLERIEVKLQTK